MACVAVLFFKINLDFDVALADAVISNAYLTGACVLLSNMMGYYQPKKKKFLFHVIIIFVLTVLTNFFTKTTLQHVLYKEPEYLDIFIKTLPYRGLLGIMCLSWCVIAHLLWYQIDEQSAMQDRLLTAQNLAKEAELNKLRHQLQPHFLFNSLNSVYALTIVNPSEAGKMITKLASFLRGTLKRDDEVWVSVADEMEYIQLYLDIEKVRFSHRLNIDIDIEEDSLGRCLPGTFLQPIVENAIKFGLYNTSNTITITIRVKITDNMLAICVANPYDPDMKATKGTGFGLSAIKRRLYLLFGDSSLLQTESRDNNLYITTLKIPLRNDKNDIN